MPPVTVQTTAAGTEPGAETATARPVRKGRQAGFALAIHGGADMAAPGTEDDVREHLAGLAALGRTMLADGAHALDVVTAMVEDLEACALYVAGRGAHPNAHGLYELDAGIMEGSAQSAGAVLAVSGVASPIRLARLIHDQLEVVQIAGPAAAALAAHHGLELVDDPPSFFHPANVLDADASPRGSHGTVGAVALDRFGDLAAATSTGGTLAKPPGRVGDSPILGAGLWADRRVAVSSTGLGEAFLRCCAAHRVAMAVELSGRGLGDAVADALAQVARLGGDGGLIAIDRAGTIVQCHNARGMKRALASDTLPPRVFVNE